MFAYRTEVGVLRGRFGYLRIAGGPRPLLVLPGMALDNEPPGRSAARAYAYGFRTLLPTHTLHVVRRPRGLPAGTSTAALAAGYAALHDEFGPVDVLAFSTGGLIAQHLALDHPQAVMRLALVSTGARIGDGGRELCRDWLDRAAAADWRGLRRALAAVAVDGPVAQRLARALVRRATPPRETDASDFVVTVCAALHHDTTARLQDVHVPTLLIGGSHDAFFPEPELRAAAQGTSEVQLRVYRGSGHGLAKQRGRRLQADLVAFLADRHRPGSG